MESKEGIDALFLFASEGILITDKHGEITRINPSAEKLFGYDPGELIGKKIEVLIPRRLSESHVNNREKYVGNPHARSMGLESDLYGLKRDGSEFPVEISLSPYSNSSGTFVIAFIVDITLRKEVEENLKNHSAELEKQVKSRTLILEEAIGELEITRKELNQALERERELNEMKTRFVSMASHEFRTPLTTMMSSLSLVTRYGEQQDLENQTKHVKKIKNSINNLTDILNDFLSVSKLEEGKVENIPEELNVRTFIEEIVTEMNAMLTPEQTIVQEHTGYELTAFDPKLLKNILFNLISNAIKFSPDSTITVGTNVTYSSVEVFVKDQGMGISKEDQEHLFERFFRGHNAVHIQGTGLGLSIVASYVALMNGTIRMDSEEHKGTQVTVTLPKLLS
jgi:PAS domain S-box-containing protein